MAKGYFKIIKVNNHRFQFKLYDLSGQTVLKSKCYSTVLACSHTLTSIKNFLAIDTYYERRIAENRQYYFNFKNTSGEFIAVSETYETIFDLEKGISFVKENAQEASITDEISI